MNIFLHEIRAYRKSTLIWTCSLVALILLFFSLFPTFASNAEEVKKLFAGFPEEVRKAIGLSSLESFVSLLGFYSFLFMYVLLCGSIQAMYLGTAILSKEVREKTADFLLTKPVSRSKILTAKILAVLTCLLVTNGIFLLFASVMASIVATESYNLTAFLMISLTLLFVQLIFMSLGIFLSVVIAKIKSVLSVSLTTVFIFFILSMFSSSIGDKDLRYITPFNFFDREYIIQHTSYEATFIVIEMIVLAAAIGASYFIYTKKDIHAV